MDVRLKRAYDSAEPTDGYRVLLDRLWPRGVSRDRAKLDKWEKELAPSTDLRQRFGHQPDRLMSSVAATSRSSAASVHASRPSAAVRVKAR